MTTKKYIVAIRSVLSPLLIALLIITGCSDKTHSPYQDNEGQTLDDTVIFNELLDDLFLETLESSPINASLSIGSLETYNLGYLNSQLDNLSDKAILAHYDRTNTILKKLNAINDDRLSEDDQFTLELLKYYYELYAEGKNYYQHPYELQHTLGVHISIPLTLTQIPIDTQEEAQNFITRLTLFPTVFTQLLDGQKEQAPKGLLPPEYILDKVIEQCTSFMTEPTSNILYLSFMDNLSHLDLAEEIKLELSNQCIDAINLYVYPSYQTLIEGLKAIKGQSTVHTGIYELPDGKGYYEYLVKYHTGVDITPDEVYQWAIDALSHAITQTQIIINGNPDLLEASEDFMTIQFETTKDIYGICDTILDEMFLDYNIPPIKDKTIPDYLEKDLPPAFYLPITLDMKKYGNMFLQKSSYEDLDIETYITICHEAIPGHHFQYCVAYQQEDLPKIRKLIDFTCFAEGWAAYIEGVALHYIDFDQPEMIELQKHNLDTIYALQTVIDIAIHYYGHTRDEIVQQYSMYFGEAVNDIVDRTIANPGEVLHYAYGRFVFNELRKQAEDELGENFDIKEFHDVVLNNGQIPLYLLQEVVRHYIDEKSL